MSTDWSKLTVAKLKDELKSRDLSTAGLKADLVKRLTEADEAPLEQTAEEAAPAEEDEPVAEDAAAPETTSVVTVADENVGEKSTQSDTERADASRTLAKEEPPAEVRYETPPKGDVPMQEDQLLAQPDVTNVGTPVVSTESSDLDAQKRKRRSTTPPPSAKRARRDGAEASEPAVTLERDDAQMKISQSTAQDDRDESHPETTQNGLPADIPTDTQDDQDRRRQERKDEDAEMQDTPETATNHHYEQSATEASRERAYVEDDRMVAPALHPATTALYIRDFMRPLRVPQVEEYLIDLAAPIGTDPDEDIIDTFHLDQIRTHAFAVFKNVSAAARVRSSLHDRVWPDEKNRKPLWVDFVPPEKVQGWIDEEQGTGRGRSARWEVIYGEDASGVTTTLVEMDGDVRPAMRAPPTGPAASSSAMGNGSAPQYPGFEAAPRGPRGSAQQMPSQMGLRTTAYPNISYKAIDEELARKRVEHIRSFVSREQGRDMGREIHRYTFEDGDQFVNRGKEVFIGIRPPARQKRHQEEMRRRANGEPPNPNYDQRGPPSRYDDRDEWRRDGGRGPPRYRDSRDDRLGGYGRDRGRYRDDPYRYRP